MYNHITLVGRLTADPESRFTQSGTQVASFTLAVDRQKRQGQDKPDTDWIPCVAWAKLAEVVCKYLAKGKQVLVDGRLQTRSYETSDGQKRKAFDVVVQNMRMLGGKPKDSEQSTGSDEPKVFDSLGIQDIGMEDDVPF